MFDPLHKWLGIPPDQQPPDLYRLLGISRFESDEDVINAAADKQLAFLHDLTNGAEAEAAEELSNQVSAARLTLLIEQKKAAYDSQLKDALVAQAARDRTFITAHTAPPQIAGQTTVAVSLPAGGILDSSGWFLRHHDKRQYGPYDFEHLLEAARAGHIVPDTEVRHPILTSDQWIVGTSIPQIAQCGVVDANALRSESVPFVVPRARRPVRHYRWQAVLRHLVSFILFFLVPMVLVLQNPRLRQIVRNSIGGNEVPSNAIAATPTPRQVPPAIHDAREPILGDSHPQAALKRSSPPRQGTVEKKRKPQSTPNVAKRPVEKNVQLKLGMNSTRWIKPLEDTYESGKYFVTAVTNSPAPIELIPSSGELSQHRATRVAFDGMSGLAIDLQLKPLGNPARLCVTGQWLCQMEDSTEGDFSLERLKNRERYLVKQRSTASVVQSLSKERKQLNQFLKSKGAKKLSEVKAAKQRIKAINALLPAASRRAANEQTYIQKFMAFKQKARQIHDRCELVVKNVDKP